MISKINNSNIGTQFVFHDAPVKSFIVYFESKETHRIFFLHWLDYILGKHKMIVARINEWGQKHRFALTDKR